MLKKRRVRTGYVFQFHILITQFQIPVNGKIVPQLNMSSLFEFLIRRK